METPLTDALNDWLKSKYKGVDIDLVVGELAKLEARTNSRTPITSEALINAGFKYENLGNDAPYEWWVRDEVHVWNFNEKHWIIDALDQASVNAEFQTMEQLNVWWIASQLQPILPQQHFEL